MKKSIEVRCKNINNAYKYSNNEYIDYIGLGSEGCIHNLPTIEDLKKFFSNVKDKKIKIIFPFIPQKYLEHTKVLIDEILETKKSVDFVLNDYGILNYLNKLNYTDGDLILGRFLEQSISLCLWHKNLIRNEKEVVSKSLINSSFLHKAKMDFFKKMGINTIESTYLPEFEFSFNEFIRQGFSVSVHYNNSTVAFTRACHTKRHFNGNCYCRNDKNCERNIELNFYKKWNIDNVEKVINSLDVYEADQVVKQNYHTLHVYGNVLYKKLDNDYQKIKNSKVDNLILDELFVEDVMKEIGKLIS